MMLRKRSRATVVNKQGVMSESQSLANLADTKHNKPSAASLLTSPRLFLGFSSKNSPDHEAAMSPTSPLDTKPFSSSTAIPFFSVGFSKKTAGVAESKHSKPVSLGILDALNDDEKPEKQSSNGRMVLFGSRLKIQIPSLNLNSSVPVVPLDFPSSPIEFGIKNKDSQLALFSPAQRTLSGELPALSPRFLTASIPVSEMELSEDYTRVISHGPVPKTTHIFDNCVVENCGDGFVASKKDGTLVTDCKCFDPCKNSFGQMEDSKVNRDEEAFQDVILDRAEE